MASVQTAMATAILDVDPNIWRLSLRGPSPHWREARHACESHRNNDGPGTRRVPRPFEVTISGAAYWAASMRTIVFWFMLDIQISPSPSSPNDEMLPGTVSSPWLTMPPMRMPFSWMSERTAPPACMP